MAQEVKKQEKIKLPPHRLIKTNPFVAIQGPIPKSAEYRLAFEQILGSRKSFVVSGSYLDHSLLDEIQNVFSGDDTLSLNYIGFRGQLMLRFYRTKDTYSPEGFFVGPHVSFSYLEKTATYSHYSYHEYLSYANANLLMGYQGIIDNFMVLEIFFGIGAKQNTKIYHDSIKGYRVDHPYGVKFTLGTSIGIVL